MSKTKNGKRFHLLLYEHVVGRYRRPALALAVLLLGLWYPVSLDLLTWPRPPADAWLLSGGLVSLAFWLFAWLGPRFAYVQPREDHLRLQTPIYRLKISYRRIQDTRPIDLAKLFPPDSLPRAGRRTLEPFFGHTALGIDLRGMPLPPLLLRLFLSRFLFAPDLEGFVLLVDDWMQLSRQISVRTDAWRAAHQQRRRGPGIGAADTLRPEEDQER
jgi:hypothetical protein